MEKLAAPYIGVREAEFLDKLLSGKLFSENHNAESSIVVEEPWRNRLPKVTVAESECDPNTLPAIQRLTNFYAKYAPEKLELGEKHVLNVVKMFEGREEMFKTLVQKYGPEPTTLRVETTSTFGPNDLLDLEIPDGVKLKIDDGVVLDVDFELCASHYSASVCKELDDKLVLRIRALIREIFSSICDRPVVREYSLLCCCKE